MRRRLRRDGRSVASETTSATGSLVTGVVRPAGSGVSGPIVGSTVVSTSDGSAPAGVCGRSGVRSAAGAAAGAARRFSRDRRRSEGTSAAPRPAGWTRPARTTATPTAVVSGTASTRPIEPTSVRTISSLNCSVCRTCSSGRS